ncbi:hypothetical protein HNQ34_001184 [Anoxybacillus tepidamans]|uniref:Transcriptional regulator n=1 Tax=Anoxybacteroides tepidamans TaxID=265948 RepID=A0A7W8IP68_9BACL|nr:transcriptional regulator [Anoxybacillus tepidamans]MBB5324092.1 hypothetical protein [Anoxybacillus tepidamans]
MNKYTNLSDEQSLTLSDNFILEHYGLNELNFESVKHYREKFATVKPHHPWNGLETKEFLYKIGAWGKLRNSSKEGVTVAGLLMFSEERIITEVLPQYFLEYRENSGAFAINGWTKRFTSQDGTWSGNVYDFYFKVMDNIVDYDDPLRSALHEAVVNSLVHADYSREGGIVIEKESDIYRFSNPGLLRIPIESAWVGGMSHLRNPNLFKMFILIGLCRRAGSGLNYIESMWKYRQWKQPEFFQQADPERTILTLTMKRYDVVFPDETAASFETDDHSSMIQNVSDGIDNELEEDTDDSVNNERDFINNDFNSINNEPNSIDSMAISMNNDLYFVNNELNSVDKKGQSVNNEPNSINKRLKSVNNGNGYDCEEADEALWRIAETARKKKRLHPNIMEQIILQLCAIRPLMLKELAHLLDRTSDGLRNNYLAKLLEEGKIQLKYPEQPNHPRQAYKAKQDS